MKKTLLTLVFAVLTIVGAMAQIKTPAASPKMKFTQTVGLTNVDVEYSRPSQKGRTLFAADGLVPYNAVWRTGANAATKITFSNDVTINGEALSKGSYAVLSVPSASSWKVSFYPYEGAGWSSYKEKTAALETTASVAMNQGNMETFLIYLDELKNNGATLNFAWGKTKASLAIGTTDAEKVEKSITSTLAGPSNGDYYTAASYYLAEGKDLNKALTWINKATSGEGTKFWHMRKKADILMALGKKMDAIAAMKKAVSIAKAAGYDSYVTELQGALRKMM